MKRLWERSLARVRNDLSGGIIVLVYLGFLLFWLLLSTGLYRYEGPGSYFELGAVYVSKFWLVALVFLCRQLLFPEARWSACFRWLFVIFAVGFCWVELTKIIGDNSFWLYGLCTAGDGLCWSLALALCGEIMGLIYRFWILWPKPSLTEYEFFRLRFQGDLFKLGLVWTAGLSLAYYYLVNFYLVDSVLYSLMTAVMNLLLATGFFLLYCAKIRRWSQDEIRALDRQIVPYLDWRSNCKNNDNGAIIEISAELHYLCLVRDCWERWKRPELCLWVYLAYLSLIALPFTFPRIFGVVIEVSSFH